MLQEEVDEAVVKIKGRISIQSYLYSIRGLNGIYDKKIKRTLVILNSILNRLINYDVINHTDTYFYKLYSNAIKYSSHLSGHIINDPLLAPTLTLVDTDSGFNLSWITSSFEESGYKVLFSTDNILFTELTSTINTTYLDDDLDRLDFNTTYYYAIVAIASGRLDSLRSNIVSGQIALEPPVLTLVDTDEGFNLSWVSEGGNFEEFYLVRYSEDNITFITIDTVTSDITTYLDDDFDRLTFNDTKYYSIISSYDVDNLSVPSNVVSGQVLFNAPTNLILESLTSTDVELSWTNTNAIATNQILEFSNDNVNWFVYDDTILTEATTFTDNDLNQGTEYYFRIYAYNSDYDVDSAYSNVVNGITTLATPSSLVGTAISDTQINLTWVNNSDGFETEIEIYRSLDNITFGLLDTVATGTTSYNDTGLSVDTTYYYKIRAINLLVNSSYSSTINKKTLFAFTFYSKATVAATFAVSITYGGADTPKWVLPNGSIITNTSVSVHGGTYGFDATSKTVKLLIDDKSELLTFVATSTTKLDGAIDFRVFVGSTVSNITCGTGTLTSLNCDVIDYTDGFTITCASQNLTTFVTNLSSTAIVGSINVSSNYLTSWTRGSLVYDTYAAFVATSLNFSGNTNFASMTFGADDALQLLNVSDCTNLTALTNLDDVDFIINSTFNCTNCTSLDPLLPTSISGTFSNLILTGCDLSTNVDLNNYDYGNNATIEFIGMLNAITITLITTMSGGSISSYKFTQIVPSSYTLDLSNVIVSSNGIALQMSGIAFTAITQGTGKIAAIRFDNCNLTGSIDLSNYTLDGANNGSNIMRFENNPLLTNLIFGAAILTNDVFGGYTLSGCALGAFNAASFGQYMFTGNSGVYTLANNGASTAQVNAWAIALDTLLPTEIWTGTKTIILTTGNAAATGAGATAIANLNTKGYAAT